MAYLGLTERSWRETKREFVFCLLFALVLGHGGYWKELDNVVTQHQQDLTAKTLDELKRANAGYLEYLYSAVGHAASLSYLLSAVEADERSPIHEDSLGIVGSTLSLYGRYLSVSVLDANGIIVHELSRDTRRADANPLIGSSHFMFEQISARSTYTYVSPLVPNRVSGALVTPVEPVFFIVVPLHEGGGTEVSSYLVLKGDAGNYIRPFLTEVAKGFTGVSFKLSFPNVPYYWVYDSTGWAFRSVSSDGEKPSSDTELLSLKFSLDQADGDGRLIAAPRSHLQIYSNLDGRPAELSYFDLHPTMEAEVLMEQRSWDTYLSNHIKKIWWEIYVQHVFGALGLGGIMAIFVAGFILVRDRAWSKYQEERKKSETDHLTGVLSRRGFERARRKAADLGKNRTPQAICLIDIDHFKQVNDLHGHAVGDKVLRDVASCVSRELRDMDLFARWGGEEFIAVITNVDNESAFSVAERFRKAVEGFTFNADGGTVIPVTISIGVAFIDEEGFDLAFTRADEALYKAKHEGRNRTCIA